MRRSLAKALALYLTAKLFQTGIEQSTKGYQAKGDFSRFYGCKKCYNRKKKGLAIQARQQRKKLKGAA